MLLDADKVAKHHLSFVNIPLWVSYKRHIHTPKINYKTGEIAISEIYLEQDANLAELEFALGHEVGHIVKSPKCLELSRKIDAMILNKPYWSCNLTSAHEIANWLHDPMATLHGLQSAIDKQGTFGAIKRFYARRNFRGPDNFTDLSPLVFIRLMTMYACNWELSGEKPQFSCPKAEHVFFEMFVSSKPLLKRMDRVVELLKDNIKSWIHLTNHWGEKVSHAHQGYGPKARINDTELPKTEQTGQSDPAGAGSSNESISSFLSKTTAPLEKAIPEIALSSIVTAYEETEEAAGRHKKSNERKIWTVSDKVNDLDVPGTVKKYGVFIPGITTVMKRKDEEGPAENGMTGTVYLLIDVSGSMGVAIGAAMVVSIGMIFGAKRDSHKVGISLFNASDCNILPPCRDYDKAIKIIKQLRCSGGTNCSPALEQLTQRIDDSDERARIVIISDGELREEDARKLSVFNPLVVVVNSNDTRIKWLRQQGITHVKPADTMSDLSDLFADFADSRKENLNDD